MPKRYSSKAVLKKLKKFGFVEISQKSSHLKLKQNNGPVTILLMGKNIIPAGTLNSILEKACINKKEFENA